MTQNEFDAIPSISDYLMRTYGFSKELAEEFERTTIEFGSKLLVDEMTKVKPISVSNISIEYINFKENK